MLVSEKEKRLRKSQSTVVSTAEAFYLVFRALPKKDRLAVARYIFEDEEILHSSGLTEIPNETTLKAFSEDKSAMPTFNSVDELRKDLLS
ncbi:MAG: hypothetical protein K9N10_07665 [Deltaproteobacteria bacterium]|nr:hypothetical protein [Deltaproteobacteria bacterium]